MKLIYYFQYIMISHVDEISSIKTSEYVFTTSDHVIFCGFCSLWFWYWNSQIWNNNSL